MTGFIKLAAKSSCPCTETITVLCGPKKVSAPWFRCISGPSICERRHTPGLIEDNGTSKWHFNQRQIPGLSYIKIPRRFAYTYLLYLLFTNVKGWLDTSIVALRRIMIIDIPYISIIIMPHSKPHDDGGTAELIDYQNILKHSLICPFCCNSILLWFVWFVCVW